MPTAVSIREANILNRFAWSESAESGGDRFDLESARGYSVGCIFSELSIEYCYPQSHRVDLRRRHIGGHLPAGPVPDICAIAIAAHRLGHHRHPRPAETGP